MLPLPLRKFFKSKVDKVPLNSAFWGLFYHDLITMNRLSHVHNHKPTKIIKTWQDITFTLQKMKILHTRTGQDFPSVEGDYNFARRIQVTISFPGEEPCSQRSIARVCNLAMLKNTVSNQSESSRRGPSNLDFVVHVLKRSNSFPLD